MGSFLTLLENIRNRPEMYLGDKCLLSALRAFYNGYDTARMELGIEKTIDDQKLEQFQDWVKKKYGNENTTAGLFLTILENSENEQDGFYKFFDLLDEFNRSV